MDKVAFMTAISSNLKFIISNYIPNMRQYLILDVTKQINNTYFPRELFNNYWNFNNKFEPLQDGLTSPQIKLNNIEKDKHVSGIEEYIWTIMERTHTTFNMLLFNNITIRISIEMVTVSTMWCSMFLPTIWF